MKNSIINSESQLK